MEESKIFTSRLYVIIWYMLLRGVVDWDDYLWGWYIYYLLIFWYSVHGNDNCLGLLSNQNQKIQNAAIPTLTTRDLLILYRVEIVYVSENRQADTNLIGVNPIKDSFVKREVCIMAS